MSYFEEFQAETAVEEFMYEPCDYESSIYAEDSRKPKKKSLFSKGYSEPRQRMRKSCGYTMSCFNCKYYYQSVGDKEETCQNNSVLEYDMIVDGHRVYCTHWEMCDRNDDSLFKKSGRSRLD